MVAKERATTAI